MQIPTNWKDYELIDTGDGMKLERWDKFLLARPDPQAIWPKADLKIWEKAVGTYTRNSEGGGSWKFKEKLPERWQIGYAGGRTSGEGGGSTSATELRFWVRPTDFKHTGLFPEQAVNWSWLSQQVESRKSKVESVNILNLFAYTGASTVACASAGAKVTHVDASKGIVTWAKENLELSGLGKSEVRWIVDDVFKFVEREAKRGVKYDGIIMDPPSYGRGTKGETWKIEKMLSPLVEICTKVMSDNPLFFIINSYTTGLSATVIGNALESALGAQGAKLGGRVESFELGLRASVDGRILPAGVCARW